MTNHYCVDDGGSQASSDLSEKDLDEPVLYVESISFNSKERKWPIPLKCWCRGGKRPSFSHLIASFEQLHQSNEQQTTECKQIIESDPPPVDTKANHFDNSNNMDLVYKSTSDDSSEDYDQENMRNFLRVGINSEIQSKYKFSFDDVNPNIGSFNANEFGQLHRKKQNITPQKKSDTGNSSYEHEVKDKLVHLPSKAKSDIQESKCKVTSSYHLNEWGWDDPTYELNSYADFPSLQGENNDSAGVQEQSEGFKNQPSLLNCVLRSEDFKPTGSCTVGGNKFIIENLPSEISKSTLKELLENFGKVENMKLQRVGSGFTAAVSMSSATDGQWVVDCIHGMSVFGETSEPLLCYMLQS